MSTRPKKAACKCGQPFAVTRTGKLKKYCAECRKKADAGYRKRNAAQVAQRSRDWARTHPKPVLTDAQKAARDVRFKKWLDENPGALWANHIKRMYGMLPDDYESLLRSQNGVCAICRQEPVPGKRLAVDHCHNTGIVRGLLCTNCNIGIGNLADNPARVRAAAQYLENFRCP